MKPHVKTYLKFFGYTISDFIPCELCGAQAIEIHHVKPRGMGGSKYRDNIENLMAVCRKCHEENEGKNIQELTEIHLKKMQEHGAH